MTKSLSTRLTTVEQHAVRHLADAVIAHAHRLFTAAELDVVVPLLQETLQVPAFWQRLADDADARPTFQAVQALAAQDGVTL